eukprot:UN31474
MAMSRQAYLDAMRKIDVNNDRKMSLLEFLMYKLEVSPVDLVNKPQDGMTDELEKALDRLADAKRAIEELEEKKAELAEEASGTGVKAMKARVALEKFGQKELKELNHEVSQSERAIAKARKSPELHEKGTKYFVSMGAEAAAPKKAAKASKLTDGKKDDDTGAHESVDADWKEEMLVVIRHFDYKQQAGFFLNAYWDDISEQAEALWDFALQMGKCDTKKGDSGSCLDEAQCAVFYVIT